jgi:hypothetical protein
MIAIGVAAVAVVAGLVIAARILAGRIEPYARQVAIQYLSERFDSEVQLESLHLKLPNTSPLRLILTRGRGVSARVEGRGLTMRLKGRPGSTPLFVIQKFSCDVGVESLLRPPVIVSEVAVDGMEIQVPARHPAEPSAASTVSSGRQRIAGTEVIIQKVNIRHGGLVLQPRNPQRLPLRFDVERLQLESGESGGPLKYDASLTNAKPPGTIHATGTFGPWRAEEPGDTPLTGDYVFEKADLGVFSRIAGTLHSTGQFEGTLSAIKVRGEASVPNFRLRMTGQAVPLTARFTVLVDGTDGNTILEPVTATLGSTHFTTNGGIIRHEAGQPRAISLNVAMPNGDLADVLRLTVKGAPFMEGNVVLHTKIDIPPLTGDVREKLVMDGRFEVRQGKFLHSKIQNMLNGLSKRSQGQGNNPDTDEAVSHMAGAYHLEDAVVQFQKLSFGVPGTEMDLAGNYNLDSDALNFTGTLKLQATVSQLVTGWKRLVLKPVDRFFEKEGAGTFLHIRIDGTAKAPAIGVIVAGRQVEVGLPKKPPR